MIVVDNNLERIKRLWAFVQKATLDQVSLGTNVKVNFNSSMPNHVQLEFSGMVWVPVEEYQEFERAWREEQESKHAGQ